MEVDLKGPSSLGNIEGLVLWFSARQLHVFIEVETGFFIFLFYSDDLFSKGSVSPPHSVSCLGLLQEQRKRRGGRKLAGGKKHQRAGD